MNANLSAEHTPLLECKVCTEAIDTVSIQSTSFSKTSHSSHCRDSPPPHPIHCATGLQPLHHPEHSSAGATPLRRPERSGVAAESKDLGESRDSAAQELWCCGPRRDPSITALRACAQDDVRGETGMRHTSAARSTRSFESAIMEG